MAKITKKNNPIGLVIFVIVGLIIVLYLVTQSPFFSPKASLPDQTYQLPSSPDISQPADLDDSLNYLDSINLDQLDQQLDQNYQDSQNL